MPELPWCPPGFGLVRERVRRPPPFVSPGPLSRHRSRAVSRLHYVSGCGTAGTVRDMYIGLGTLVVILIIVLIIYFVRRASLRAVRSATDASISSRDAGCLTPIPASPEDWFLSRGGAGNPTPRSTAAAPTRGRRATT